MSGSIMLTGDGVRYAQLAAAKGAIRLESLGMKHSRGSVRKAWAVHLGLKANAKHDVVIAAIQAQMNEILASREAA